MIKATERARVNLNQTVFFLCELIMLVWDAFGVLRQTVDSKFEIPDIKFQRWRRGWDSNPRNGSPFTAFPVLPIQPLLHLSPGEEFRIANCGIQRINR